MKVVLLFVLISLFACNSKQGEKEVTFDDISQNSTKNYDDTLRSANLSKLSFYDSLSHLSQQIIDSLALPSSSIFELKTTLIVDRFGAQLTEKCYSKSEMDSLVFMRWEFKDSLKTFNAFYNWMDCFGDKCKSIKIGQEISFSKNAHLFLVNEKNIFHFESSKNMDVEKILSLFDSKEKKEAWKFIVEQKYRKKATWISRNEKGEIVVLN